MISPRASRENHKLTIRFTEAAADRLVALALEQTVPVRDFCAARFKDFQFGLKLIAQNTGRQEFVIDADAVEAPDKVLSDWVVKSYGAPAERKADQCKIGSGLPCRINCASRSR